VIKPQLTTVLEASHHDPVYDVYWLTGGKAGKECVSTSTDGRVLWWDMRNTNKPTETHTIGSSLKPVESHTLDHNFGTEENKNIKILGGTSMEYNTDAGPQKFLIGTE
jgi:dynein intermediate chain 2